MAPVKIRPEIDEYFLKIAKVVGQRSTCLRHNVGAVLVKDKQIIATGYNGAPAGTPDCLELGCLRDQQKIASGTMHEVCRGVHGEQNAIIQAALHGVQTKDTTMYVTHTPCILCTKIMINAGVKRVVSYQGYPDEASKELLKTAGIELVVLPEPELEMGDVGERVLVVERSHYEKCGKFEGIKTDNVKKYYDKLLAGVKYLDRAHAETDITHKQIIPQFLVRHGDEFYISKRLNGTDDERLRDIFYFAFGGHINPVDTAEKTGDVIERAARRELEEELTCNIKSCKHIGFVNDEVMAVSKYHLGVLYLLELKDKKCYTNEKDQLEGFWVNRKDLGKYFEEADSWSRYEWLDLVKKGAI
jgi:dCMP deaminase